MKTKSIYLVVLLLLVSFEAGASDEDLSFGVGAGALYGGIGMNIGMRRDYDFRYLAAGCAGVGYSSVDGWQTSCGVGVGWIWANILSKSTNKHGLGFYLGPVGLRKGGTFNPVYGVGISYDYFFKGINSSGWNLGVTPTIGRRNGDNNGYLLLQVGYQF
jgi:hypothetical protein